MGGLVIVLCDEIQFGENAVIFTAGGTLLPLKVYLHPHTYLTKTQLENLVQKTTLGK